MAANDKGKQAPIRSQGGKDVRREDRETLSTDASATDDAYDGWLPKNRPTIGKLLRDQQEQQENPVLNRNDDSTVVSMVTDVFLGASLETES